MIEQRLHDEAQQALEPGEELLWAGRPEPFRLVRTKMVPMLIGVLFLLLFFLVYRSSLSAPGPSINANPRSFSLRPAILMTGGLLTLYSILLPVLSYRKALRTVYMATDRRVVSLDQGRLTQTLRYDDMQLPILNLDRHRTGDIWFSRKFSADADGSLIGGSFFYGVRDAEQVHRLVLKRITGRADGHTTDRAVHDYLELLLQGKRALDEDPSRE